MKTKKIKIAIVEDHAFYNNVIQSQVSDLCLSKDSAHFKFDITSVDNVYKLLNEEKSVYQVIILDSHFTNNTQKTDYNVMDIIEEIKLKNKDCFFISIAGYREMTVSAYMYKDNELQYTYSKQSAVKNENHEEKCSIPALYKLMDKFIDGLLMDLSRSHRIAA